MVGVCADKEGSAPCSVFLDHPAADGIAENEPVGAAELCIHL